MTPRRPRAFDVCDGRMDRDRTRARSQEQARIISDASACAARLMLCKVSDADLDATVEGYLRGIFAAYAARTDHPKAASAFGKASTIEFVRAPAARAEAERVFAKVSASNDQTGSEAAPLPHHSDSEAA